MQKNTPHTYPITQKNIYDFEDIFDASTQKQPCAPVWQTFWWTRLMLESGSISKGFCIYDKKKKRGFCIQKRSLGAGKFGLFCIGLTYELSTQEQALLKDLTKNEACLFVQIEPISEMPTLPSFREKTYKHFIEPTTARINLIQTPEEIMQNMKPKGRYNIRLAQKKDISIIKSNTPESVDIFFGLLEQTTNRNHFSGNHHDYYQKLCSILEERNMGGLYLAQKDGHTIAASIFIFFGDTATYYYGASTNDNKLRKYMASYLLQWEAMTEGKKRNCIWFDFLGVADQNGKPEHLRGVTDFKMKFGPEIHTWPQVQMYSPNPLALHLYMLARNIKSLFKK